MDALRAELSRQKEQSKQQTNAALAVSASSSSNSLESDGKKKFVRRGDVERVKQAERDQTEQERLQKKRKFELAQAGGSRESTPIDSAPAEIVFVPMQREEVVRRLRLMNQPVTYFGESDEERQRRLHQIELIVSERQQGSSAGAQKNIFQLMNESVEAEIEAAMAAGDDANESNSDDEEHAQNGAKSQGPIGASGSAAGDGNASKLKRVRSDFSSAEEFALCYLKEVLREWEEELEARPEAEKRTAHGKYAKATWHQTRQYLKPLFKQLKRKSCPADIVEYMDRIVAFCRDREYVKANDSYLQMSIGNAPWPMGVSMAGIHERSGRDKLEEKHSAHILNDETQRKFIISIKRLMTFAQTKYPNETNTKNCG